MYMYLIAHVYMHIYGTGLSVCLIVVTLIKPTKSSLIVHKDQCAHFMWYRRGVRNTPKKRTRFRNPEISLEISRFPLGFQDFT